MAWGREGWRGDMLLVHLSQSLPIARVGGHGMGARKRRESLLQDAGADCSVVLPRPPPQLFSPSRMCGLRALDGEKGGRGQHLLTTCSEMNPLGT